MDSQEIEGKLNQPVMCLWDGGSTEKGVGKSVGGSRLNCSPHKLSVVLRAGRDTEDDALVGEERKEVVGIMTSFLVTADRQPFETPRSSTFNVQCSKANYHWSPLISLTHSI